MVHTGELQANYTYMVIFNRKSLVSNSITPATVRDVQTLRMSVKDLLAQRSNRLTLARGDGAGTLYYLARLNLQIPAAQATAASQGITVSRQYFSGSDKSGPIAHAKIGDLITVRLTITVPKEVHYFALEDPFPAGTEAVDTSLLTSSQLAQPGQIEQVAASDGFWYWGWWYFQHAELRDSQLHLYADQLPAGTFVYTYQLRAAFAGQFQVIPTSAYSFYFPEIFGRSAGAMFTVDDPNEVF
jgi:uncharacterized protein YfaS (alpha-2-macroglobulin family)